MTRTTTLVTRDHATGLRRNPLRHTNSNPPTPFGCRWCGAEQSWHGTRWVSSAGLHTWAQPTETQILARMKARRTARLDAAPPKYHATTRWTGTASNPDDEGYALCADCGTDACPQYQRIQTRLAIRMTEYPPGYKGAGPWGADARLPF